MLKINLSKFTLRFLKSLPTKHLKQIERKLHEISFTPVLSDSKKLIGYKDFFRVDVGEYRIIYKIDEAEGILFVSLVGKRNDSEVYKKFKRLAH